MLVNFVNARVCSLLMMSSANSRQPQFPLVSEDLLPLLWFTMNTLMKQTSLQHLGGLIRRTLTKSTISHSPRGYEGEGKTTMHIMNRDDEFGLMIDGFSQAGFRLNNHMTILGPMVLFPRSVLAWNIAGILDVTEESLCLLGVLEPKIDILVLGTGDKTDSNKIYTMLHGFSRKHNISLEVLPTEAACPTFNFLNAEGRNVVGAMLPPQNIKYADDDLLRSKLRYEKLFDKQ